MNRWTLPIGLSVVLSACATGVPVPSGTQSIREVAHVLTRDEVLTGNLSLAYDNHGQERVKWPELREYLLKHGVADEEIVDGSVIAGRTQYYRHNVASGIIRQYLRPAFVPATLRPMVGAVVTVENVDGLATVVNVRHPSLEEGSCEYRVTEKGAVSKFLGAINPIGSPGAVSLYCPDVERAGWFPAKHHMGVEWFSTNFMNQ